MSNSMIIGAQVQQTNVADPDAAVLVSVIGVRR